VELSVSTRLYMHVVAQRSPQPLRLGCQSTAVTVVGALKDMNLNDWNSYEAWASQEIGLSHAFILL
jgi:hypothetical protein